MAGGEGGGDPLAALASLSAWLEPVPIVPIVPIVPRVLSVPLVVPIAIIVSTSIDRLTHSPQMSRRLLPR